MEKNSAEKIRDAVLKGLRRAGMKPKQTRSPKRYHYQINLANPGTGREIEKVLKDLGYAKGKTFGGRFHYEIPVPREQWSGGGNDIVDIGVYGLPFDMDEPADEHVVHLETHVSREEGVTRPKFNFASVPTLMGKTAQVPKTASDAMFILKDDVEVFYNPFTQGLEVGMGGEWWGGKVGMGKNVFRHRKERVDDAYRPVTVHVAKVGHAIRFAIGGGFGMGTTVMMKLV